MWLNLHVVSVMCPCGLSALHCVKQDYGMDGMDVELSQPNRDESTAHMCRLWDAAASSLSKALLQHSQSDRLNPPRMLLLMLLLL